MAFDAARDRPDLPPLRHVLLGMNAHINYDLPQALIAVIAPADFDDPGIRRSRAADHTHVDTVLLARVGAEDDEVRASGPVSLLDRLLGPVNRAATRRVLAESRPKVWRNTEALCAAKLVELTAPGQVMLRLACRGFGVVLPVPA